MACPLPILDGNAVKWDVSDELELYSERDKNGIVTASLDAKKRETYIKPAAEKEACPEGKDRNPSSNTDLLLVVHIAALTSRVSSWPPTAYFAILATSGMQRERRSG
jgi:hypothetical protein